MPTIKGNPVQGAEEYELLYFMGDGNGLILLGDFGCILNENIIVDENNNIVTGSGYVFSIEHLPTTTLRAPLAYKFVSYYNDAEGASHIIWSQDLNEDNCYTVIPPADGEINFEEDQTYYMGIFWKYEDMSDPHSAMIECGDWNENWSSSDEINFEIDVEGVFAVRAHGTGFDSSDLSNCVEYRVE